MDAQTFKFVGVETNGASASELQEAKKRILGSKFTCEFYGNDVQLNINWKGDEQPQTVVYTKNANGNYIYTYPNPDFYEILKFNTWAKYIRGGVIEMYSKEGQKPKLLTKMVFERN